MAKIRLRLGRCEVEIESGDFYVDHRTVASVIDEMVKSVQNMALQAQLLPNAAPDAAVAGIVEAGGDGSRRGQFAQGADGARPTPSTAAAASTTAAAPPLIKAQQASVAAVAAVAADGGGGAAAPPASAAPDPASGPAAPECGDLSSVLDCLDEAEAFEPEFCEPGRVPPSEVGGRLRAMAASGFFEHPRTVSDAVDEMARRGWLAGPLDVSKALVRMALGREMRRESRGHMAYYCRCPARAPGARPAAGAAAVAPVLS